MSSQEHSDLNEILPQVFKRKDLPKMRTVLPRFASVCTCFASVCARALALFIVCAGQAPSGVGGGMERATEREERPMNRERPMNTVHAWVLQREA